MKVWKKRIPKIFVMLFLVFIMLTYIYVLGSQSELVKASFVQENDKSNEVSDIINSIDCSRILSHVYNLSTSGSRVTGYKGSIKAAEYIKETFKEYGVKVETQTYKVAVPLDLGTTITISSPNINKVFKAYALWPNGIQTCPATNLKGKLIYIPGKSLEDFDGHDLKDSIILMDFNSKDNWIFAADMGARAVIFIEPTQTYSEEAFSKRVETPLYFPRIYVNRSVGEELKKIISDSPSDVYVTINSKMVWREIEASNIIGKVEGEMPNDIIMIASHYDAWSIVPNKTYGASDALGTSLLLELARYFSTHPPKRTVWLLAFSGHYQGLAGVREFIKENFFLEEVQNGTKKLWMFVNLGPFSWDTDELQLLGTSYFCGAGEQIGTLTDRYNWVRQKIFNQYLMDESFDNVIKELTGKSLKSLVQERLHNVMWWGSLQRPHIFESEPVLMCGGLGFTVLSSPLNAFDKIFGVPLNDFSEIQIERLKPQFLITSWIIKHIVDESDWQIKWQDVIPIELYVTRWAYQTAGFITLKGEVVAFDYTIGWYKRIPNAIVQVRSAVMAYPFSAITTISDENGSFEVHGVAPFVISFQRSSWEATAFVINETDGTIIYAPDQGIHGISNFAPPISYGWRARGTTDLLPMATPMKITVAVANLRSITLFDILDPKFLRPLARLDPRTQLRWGGARGASASAMAGQGGWYVGTGGSIRPLDFEIKSDLLAYGSYFNPWETIGLAFVPPYSTVSVLITAGGILTAEESVPSAFIINSSDEFPEGKGISIKDDPLVIHFTAYEYAKDVYLATSHRYNALKAYNVRSLSIEENLKNAEKYLQLAKSFYENKVYSKAYSCALWASSYLYRAYGETMGLIQDAAMVTISLFSLIIIASLTIERVVINATTGSKRLIGISLIISFFGLSLYLLHPSFHLMTNPSMGLFGTLLWFIFGATIIILFSEAERIMKTLSIKFLGRHTLEKGGVSAMIMAFSTSVGLMRKHPTRTFLTIFTTFIITASVMSFTSTSAYTQIRHSSTPYSSTNTLYPIGIQVEKNYGDPPLGPLADELPFALKTIVGDNFSVMPRYVYYPQSVWYYTPAVSLPVTSTKNEIRVLAAVGLTPEESALILSKAATNVSRSFTENDYNVCYLTEKQASALNVTTGDIVTFSGYQLIVVGIIKSDILNEIKDLNGYQAGVTDPMYLPILANAKAYPAVTGAAAAAYPRLGWDSAIIVPSNFAKSLGAYITTVNIVPKSDKVSPSEVVNLASQIAAILETNVWYKVGESIYSVSRVHDYYVIGYQAVLLIAVLGSLNIAITTFSSVRERVGEIRILALSGLAPRESMIMLIVESGIYAIAGGICGYFAGFALNKILASVGMLPSYFPFNYASMSILYSLFTIILASLLGAIFPSFTAAKMVTPSLKRKWELPTKPRGDSWGIPLPFRIPTREAAIGMLFFLKEYFEKGGRIGRMYKVRGISDVSLEKMSLEIELDHAPYELNVTSHVVIQILEAEGNYVFNVNCRKLTGPRSMWVSSNYSFIDALRKQFILWGSLSESEKEKYISLVRG